MSFQAALKIMKMKADDYVVPADRKPVKFPPYLIDRLDYNSAAVLGFYKKSPVQRIHEAGIKRGS